MASTHRAAQAAPAERPGTARGRVASLRREVLLLPLLLLAACSGAEPTALQPAPTATTSSPSSTAETRTGPIGDRSNAAASCAEGYSPTALANTAFAFDGTVTDIGPGTTNKPGRGQLDTAAVTFTVNEWFSGGSSDTVTVDLIRPTVDAGSAETPVYEEGTRLLVSGEPRWGGEPLDDPIAWTCGDFTRYYEEAVADEWRRATA